MCEVILFLRQTPLHPEHYRFLPVHQSEGVRSVMTLLCATELPTRSKSSFQASELLILSLIWWCFLLSLTTCRDACQIVRNLEPIVIGPVRLNVPRGNPTRKPGHCFST